MAICGTAICGSRSPASPAGSCRVRPIISSITPTNPAHFDKNLGFALALWDWAFGTLAIPAKAREPIAFGVGELRGDFASATRSLIRPFVCAGEQIAPAAAPQNPRSPFTRAARLRL